MKLRFLALAVALAAPAAHAQYAYSYAPSTGDAALDAVLNAINLLYDDEPEYYVEQIVYETQAPPVIVREYIVERDYAPADVYMIGELAQISGRPFADVARRFDADRGRGWGVIAKELGIKPGSARFHALKDGTTGFVERGKAKKEKHGGGYVAAADDSRRGPGTDKNKDKAKGKDKGKHK